MQRLIAVVLITAIAAAGALLPPRSARAQKSLDAFAQTAIRDLYAHARVVSKNDRELNKIGKGFVDAYKLRDQELWYKEPDRVRFQAKWGLFTIRRITNGGRQLADYPAHRRVFDISKQPGKGDSISDVGLITPGWLSDVESEWLRSEARDGKPLQVFSFWRRQDPKAKHTVWVDPATKTIVDQIAHHRGKRKVGFKKRLVYSDLQQIEGIWIPSKATLYNGEDRIAAVMRYDRIRVNSGLKDNLFTF